MTTNLAESINFALKKIGNIPICALVKSTYTRCNTLFNQRGKEVASMITSGQVYTQVVNKAMEDAQRKKNYNIVLEFDQCDA